MIELKSSMARMNSKLLLVGLCLSSAPLCFGQTKYRLANGHLDVAAVAVDLKSKNTLKSTLAHKSVEYFGAKAIPDIIDYIEQAFTAKSDLTDDVYFLLQDFGRAGKPYLIEAATKGSDVARLISVKTISACLTQERHSYLSNDDGDNSWVKDDDVKQAVLKSCDDEIPTIQAYGVTICNWLGSKEHKALSFKLIKNEEISEYTRWDILTSLLSQDAGNEKDILEAAKSLVEWNLLALTLEFDEAIVNETTRKFLLGLLDPKLFEDAEIRSRMKVAILSRLCEFRNRADYNLARESVQSDDLLIAEAAIRLIGATGGSEVVDYLKELCKSEDYLVHAAALEGLGYTDDEKIIPFLKQVVKDDEDFGTSAIAALGHTRRYDLIEFLTPLKTSGDKDKELAAMVAIHELKTRQHQK